MLNINIKKLVIKKLSKIIKNVVYETQKENDLKCEYRYGNNIKIMPHAHISSDTKIGDYTYVGYYSRITKAVIGRYCSIANYVSIGVGEHELNNISTSSWFSNNRYEELTQKDCLIGNDVWIGVDSIIKRGVKIGNGAIIGANSFVNKDVPDFGIVGGSPAKLIKYRFSEEMRKRISETSWWNYDLEKAKFFIDKL